MCVEGGLCVILSFERFKKFPTHNLLRYSWVGVRSLCVEYVWLCAGHASAVSAYASDLVRNSARPRPSTDAPPSHHAWTAHVSRSSRNKSACTWNVRKACVFGRAPSVIYASGVRRMFVEYCTIFARTCICRRARYCSKTFLGRGGWGVLIQNKNISFVNLGSQDLSVRSNWLPCCINDDVVRHMCCIFVEVVSVEREKRKCDIFQVETGVRVVNMVLSVVDL